jgi:uncharacterized protein
LTQTYHPIPILISGAFNSGKTTFIRAVSEIDVVSTEYQGDNELFRVALDFGRITVPEQPIAIYFFANPGTWRMPPIETLFPEEMRRRCGYIAMLDGAPAPEWVNYHQRESTLIINIARDRDLPFVVAATKQDKAGAYSPDELHNLLQLPADMNILPCSAQTDPDSVRRILLELLVLLPQDEVVQQAQNTVRGMIK